MTATNRAAQLAKIHKVLKKHYKPTSTPTDRSILEHLLYACCLEDARPEAADDAFAKLQQNYFDWNEVRVTTVAELSEQLGMLPAPSSSAANLKRALQAVFESHFQFDIEFLKKQNLGKSEKDLEKYASNNPFLIAYVVQHGLGGHAIPCSKGVIELMRILGVITPAEAEKKHVPGLERAIPKNKGDEFASLIHQFGADFVANSNGAHLRTVLAEIDPTAKDRIPKRGARKDDKPEGIADERRGSNARDGGARDSGARDGGSREASSRETASREGSPRSAKPAGKEAEEGPKKATARVESRKGKPAPAKPTGEEKSESNRRQPERAASDEKKSAPKKLAKKKPR